MKRILVSGGLGYMGSQPIRIAKRREGDIPVMYASTKKAKEELGWVSERSLDDMTLSAWKWEQKLAANKSHDE